MKYRIIDHTADFGLQVFASDLKTLFADAAHAMFDQVTDINRLKGLTEYHVYVTGSDWPDLMVNWLREVLYLWTGEEKLVKKARILSLSEYELSAKLLYDTYEPDRHIIKNEIKAVTYHQIQVKNLPDRRWMSQIIFDV
ncbi:MAG: archease [Thermodesulfobacteriota bacterium]|nr:archease [Thermodesulfobacteriota bacterium]